MATQVRRSYTRTGRTSGAQVIGLAELRAALRAAGPGFAKALTQAHKNVAKVGAMYAQAQARGMGGMQAKAAGAIKGTATQTRAAIGVSGSKTYPMAKPAFWGSDKRAGWYARYRYKDSAARQFPPWVGSSWEAAKRGEGPIAINDALAAHLPELLELYQIEIDDLTSEAFPEP